MIPAPHPSEECVRKHLDRVLASAEFRNSQRMRRFLTFVVETTLGSNPTQLKEQVIGPAVFDRSASTYNPANDPIVRNEARRLRRKLELYYDSEGRSESLRIEIPKGGYTPVFLEIHPDPDPEPSVGEQQRIFPGSSENKKRTEGMAVPVSAALALCLVLASLPFMPHFRLSASAHQLEARQEYTLGRRMLTDEPLPKQFAFPHLQRAVQLDPNYADAYAGLGIAYSMAVTRRQLPEAGN